MTLSQIRAALLARTPNGRLTDVRRLWVVAAGVIGVALVLGAFGAGWACSRSTPIPLVEVAQVYGVLHDGSADDERCIEKADSSVVCGHLRLHVEDQSPSSAATSVAASLRFLPIAVTHRTHRFSG